MSVGKELESFPNLIENSVQNTYSQSHMKRVQSIKKKKELCHE